MSSIFLLAVFSIALQEQQSNYDPSTTSGKVTVTDTEFEYDDGKKVPLRIYLPESESAAPVILFSHGLGGSRKNNPYLGNHWAGRGYVVVFMQHSGSDEEIRKDVPRRERLKAFKAAASPESLKRRTGDVPATLDQLEKWNAQGQKLASRLDMEKIGMSGHSFGAITTQALSGQSYGRRGKMFTDERIKASIAMSPSAPQIGNDERTFGEIKIPCLLMTGTKDKSVIARLTAEDRLKVFEQLPSNGHFYELVLYDAEHMAFSERTLSGGAQRNPNHHKSILALSSAFWDTYLKEDQPAKNWLNGKESKKILDSKDKWQMK